MKYIAILLLFSLDLNAQVREVALQMDTKNMVSICYSQQETFLRFEVETGLQDFDNLYSNCTMKGTVHLKKWTFLAGGGVEFVRFEETESHIGTWQKRNIIEAGILRRFCNSELQLNYWVGDKWPTLRFRQYL